MTDAWPPQPDVFREATPEPLPTPALKAAVRVHLLATEVLDVVDEVAPVPQPFRWNSDHEWAASQMVAANPSLADALVEFELGSGCCLLTSLDWPITPERAAELGEIWREAQEHQLAIDVAQAPRPLGS